MEKDESSSTCKRCGKPLRNEKSVKVGYGRTCERLIKLNK